MTNGRSNVLQSCMNFNRQLLIIFPLQTITFFSYPLVLPMETIFFSLKPKLSLDLKSAAKVFNQKTYPFRKYFLPICLGKGRDSSFSIIKNINILSFIKYCHILSHRSSGTALIFLIHSFICI